jgi:hypothetical protein
MRGTVIERPDVAADADEPVGASRRPGPRNFLEPSEQRRLMWRVLPFGLAVVLVLSFVERRWRGEPAAPPPQVDTTLDAVRGPPPDDEAVIIEAPEEPTAEADPAIPLSAARVSLDQVRDDTFFRDADIDAWLQTWTTLREAGADRLATAPAPQVSFAELFGQPRSFRGRLVRLRGTFHRLEYLQAPANGYGIEGYWQGWLEPQGGPASPVVVQCLHLPEGMPTGLRIHETVTVTGYFFKRYAYQATDTIRVAPLVMTLEPAWRRAVAAPAAGTSLAAWVAATLGVLVAVSLAAWWWGGPPARRSARREVDVDLSLAGFEPTSTGEILRQMAASQETAAPGPRDAASLPTVNEEAER